jgi:hypothetical protein
MDTFGVVVTVIVMLAVAGYILLFERRRARQIERDLRERRGAQRSGRNGPAPR